MLFAAVQHSSLVFNFNICNHAYYDDDGDEDSLLVECLINWLYFFYLPSFLPFTPPTTINNKKHSVASISLNKDVKDVERQGEHELIENFNH